jgi:glycosyltransferase involved in cell wall biosynthesis
MPLLSICIPTYNQPIAIDYLLNSIVAQWCTNIEVIVCDDSQDEETRLIVYKYSKLIPLKYIRRNRAGLDKAVIDLTDMAKGDYVWWIGDDKILPSGITTVTGFLKKHAPDFLWVNSVDELNPVQRTFNLLDDQITYDPNELLSFDIGLLGFITATIFKRDLAAKYLTSASSYQGSAWVCLYLILCVITSGGKLAILNTPCFSSFPKPSGEVRWYDQFQVYGINLLHVALNFSEYFDKKKLNFALSRNLERVLRSILVERALGYKTGFASSSVSLKLLIKNYYKFPLLWLYLPFLIMPSAIVKIFYALYKTVNRGV